MPLRAAGWLAVAGGLTSCTAITDLDPLHEAEDASGAGAASAASSSSGTPPGALSFTDDALAGEFGEGELTGIVWKDDHLELDGGASGVFVSRTFDAGADARWMTLAYSGPAPYGKALRDDGLPDSGYGEAGANLTELIVLFHLDPGGSLRDGATVADASGKQNDAFVVNAARPALVYDDGMFGGGIAFAGGNYVYVPVDSTSDLQLGTSDFTWAYWMKTADDCDRHNVHIGTEGTAAPRTHLWVGCAADLDTCPSQPGRIGGALLSDQDNLDGVIFCGESAVNDGGWHHVALVKKGHASSEVSVFVDGLLDASWPAAFTHTLQFEAGTPFSVGAFKEAIDPTTGLLDEVAIFKRALEPQEIAALHTRGAARLRFQVRTCQMPSCADAPDFVGPGADSASYWIEPSDVARGAPFALEPEPNGRYLQYRALFDSTSPGISPALQAVTITATPN